MSLNKQLFVAEPFNTAEESAASPLMGKEATEDTEVALEESRFASFKRSSIVLGLLVGFFIQFSTLGANFLVITIWGEDVVTKTKSDIVTFSLLWSFFTSAMAIVILGFLRNLVTIAFKYYFIFLVSRRRIGQKILKKDIGILVPEIFDLWVQIECPFDKRPEVLRPGFVGNNELPPDFMPT